MNATTVLNFLNECSRVDPEFTNILIGNKNRVNETLLYNIAKSIKNRVFNRFLDPVSRVNTYGYSYVYLLEIINSMLISSGENSIIVASTDTNNHITLSIKPKINEDIKNG